MKAAHGKMKNRGKVSLVAFVFFKDGCMARLSIIFQSRWLVPASFLLLLTAFHLVFGQFFPTRNGTLGHDYSHALPNLLDGYFWLRSNGLFEPFWFTPAFCGGQPVLGDQASIYYSVTQILTLFVNPLASVYATVLLFASLGFWGFYLLLRTCFDTSRQAALLGGALFMFNGFFIHRAMIGHLTFHSVMLVPLIAWLLLRPAVNNRVFAVLFNGSAGGSLLAYGIYSGIGSQILPCALAVLGITCIHGITGRISRGFVPRSAIAALVSIGLSAAKLTALLSFLRNFPRNDYSLPGVTGIWNAMHLLFSALFFAPTNIAEQARALTTNMQWALERHEWEYGVTMIPLLLILAGTASWFYRIRGAHPQLNISITRYGWFALLGLILALPLALNIYTPDWNAFLKQAPVIKSSSALVRWFLVYIPLAILSSALFFDKISQLPGRRNGIFTAALVALVLLNAVKDRTFYHTQGYRPDIIVDAWQSARTSTAQPRIQHVGTFANASDQIYNRNDLIAFGASQLACYNPSFGYGLEYFPIKALHPGLALEEKNGLLNIKNPACYLYPEQNHCTPGDHFTSAQREAAQAFTSYKPYPFSFSPAQQIANRVTQATLLLVVLLAVAPLMFAPAFLRKLKSSMPDKLA